MANTNDILKGNVLEDEELANVAGGISSDYTVKRIYKSKEDLYNGLRNSVNLTTAEIDALIANNNINIGDSYKSVYVKKLWVQVVIKFDSTTKKRSVESITQI